MEKLDIIILGATGFTGKHVVKKLLNIKKDNEYKEITFGMAGRSVDKMKELLKELNESGLDTSNIPIIECDIKNEASLKSVTKQSKVMMNSAGPYTILGEPVVKACIESGTHYVDITAELYFMLTTYHQFNEAAEKANVLVVTACGFGSLPGVVGVAHLQKYFDGTLNSVDCYVKLDFPRGALIPGPNKCLIHYGTWASLVHELQNFRKYWDLKSQVYPAPLLPIEQDKKLKKRFFHRNQKRWWFPYPGPDEDIVEYTQRYVQEKKGIKPHFFQIFTTMPLLIHFIIVIPAFIMYYYLCYLKCFRKLLWKYPGFFTLGYMTHKGPSEKIMNDTKFTFTLNGKGEKVTASGDIIEKSMTLKVSGSNPGYGATASAFVFSAITILKDHSSMPRGGVLTSGSAFYDTLLVDRLNKDEIKFEFDKHEKTFPL